MSLASTVKSVFNPGPSKPGALAEAVVKGDLGRVKSLLKAGVDLYEELQNGFGGTAMTRAAYLGNIKILETLIAAGADVNRKSAAGETPLCYAVRGGNIATVEFLLKHDADPNLREKSGMTPLMLAASWGRPSVTRLLLDNGADPETEMLPGTGQTALNAARDHLDTEQRTGNRPHEVAEFKEVIKLLENYEQEKKTAAENKARAEEAALARINDPRLQHDIPARRPWKLPKPSDSV